ncbi:WecB/TagA/CpsF family glycosyltransferase [Patescibacteria group bacterium]|nr:WecB/TagA/CpsF family glycosyltransferase [Patescibacteria group bacterium]MBU4601353.1 WecB/TagA/CpsF family glycosyltransferase [Patescibacteria group bacterium]
MNYNKINILGVNISTLNKKEAIKKIEQFLFSGKDGQYQIVTPNPEFLLQAQKDEEFFHILNTADLAAPDGIGLKFAGWLMGKNITRIAGADLVKDILNIAQEKNLKVMVINWNEGLSDADDIKNTVKNKYPNLFLQVRDIERENAMADLERIKAFAPDILMSSLGAPWQEKFIYHNLPNLPSVKLGIGAGGAFDFLTGRIKRAPKLFRVLGLEWLWRLLKQPWRIKRIYNAVMVFPFEFFKWRFLLPFIYRQNVACILYKKVIKLAATNGDHANKTKGGKYKILLVLREEDPNHWQLPQGGIDGEDVKTAGARELREELNTDKFKIIKTFKNVYKYKFSDQIGKYGTQKGTALGYKGQRQSLVIAEFLGQDSDIEVNFWDHSGWKWVNSEQVISQVFPIRRDAIKIFLEKFDNIDK